MTAVIKLICTVTRINIAAKGGQVEQSVSLWVLTNGHAFEYCMPGSRKISLGCFRFIIIKLTNIKIRGNSVAISESKQTPSFKQLYDNNQTGS